MGIGKFLKCLLGTKTTKKRTQNNRTNKEIDINKIKLRLENEIKEKFGINFDVDTSLVGIDKKGKIYSQFYECDNCGHFQQDMFDDKIITCKKCGFSIYNFGGVHIKNKKLFSNIRENQNPQKICMGVYREKLPDISIIGIRKSIFEYDNIDTRDDIKENIDNLVINCEKMESLYIQDGKIIPPRIYENIAKIFRDIGDYEREKSVCEYFVMLAEFDRNLAKIQGIDRVTLYKTRFFDEAKKIIKKQPSVKKRSAKIDKSSLKYDEGPHKKPRAGSLAAQCIELGVPLTKIKCQWSKIDRKYDLGNGVLVTRPEDVVMNILRAEGYSGTPYEFAPYQMLMQASCLDYVKECSKSIFLENPHSRTFSVQLDMYGMDKDKASRLIKSAGWLAVKRDFEEIYENHQIREWFPYLSFDDVSMVFNALTRKKFEKMVELFFDNPEENSIGWPDIIACKDNKLRMIEVKTTDKIRDTQRRMFPIITDVLGVPVEVFQLEKKYEKQNNT